MKIIEDILEDISIKNSEFESVLVASVAIENVKVNFDFLYDYIVPKTLIYSISIGMRCFVSFGKNLKPRLALVCELKSVQLNELNKSEKKLKEILELIDFTPLIGKNLIKVAFYVSKSCFCTIYEAFNIMVPLNSKKKINMNNKTNKNKKIKLIDEKKYKSIDFNLNNEQNLIFNEILYWYKFKNQPALLQGVTGSGKTFVILKLCKEVLKENKKVIFMVPEISLISQSVEIFSSYFYDELQKNPDFISIIHGKLTNSNRNEQWLKIKRNDAKIIIGTRSSIFAPCDDIGIIVMDEEHEFTYKSECTPRFHARNVAFFRCKNENAKLLLCSATPSIETFYYAKNNRYHLSVLKNRFGSAGLPKVEIIDMNTHIRTKPNFLINDILLNKIKKTILNGEQVMILLDRRGFHTLVRCSACAQVLMCKNCNITLNYHIDNNKLKCHWCGYEIDFCKKCQNCSEEKLVFMGFGTQRLEEEINKRIPNSKVLRIDTDVTNEKGYDFFLKDFREKKYNIMIGTRMIAKGLNFDDVTLVGVVSFEQSIYDIDFRSSERAFCLISQVLGRSGRKEKPGTAFIQTLDTKNHVIKFALNQNYEDFFNQEIIFRKMLIYPPFSDICQVGFFCTDEKIAFKNCKNFHEILKEEAKNFNIPLRILNPTPAVVKKAFNKFRFKIIIKCKNSEKFRFFITKVLKNYEINGNIKKNNVKFKTSVFIDMNSLSLF